MIVGLRHVGIVVNDMEKMLHFYKEVLGFRVVKRERESGSPIDNMIGFVDIRLTTVKLCTPDRGMIELLKFNAPTRDTRYERDLCDYGISHISFTVDDVDAEYIRLRQGKVPFISQPQVSGNAKVAFCYDPEENVIELVQVLH